MRRWTALITAIVFLFVVATLYGGEDISKSSGESSGAATGKALLVAFGIVVLVVIIIALAGGAVSTGVLASLKKKEKEKKEQVKEVIEEAARSDGEKPNIGILARLYALTPSQVEDEIALLVAADRISISRAIIDDEAATDALTQINQALEARSRTLGRFDQAGIHKLRELVRTYMGDPNFFGETYFNQVYRLLLTCN